MENMAYNKAVRDQKISFGPRTARAKMGHVFPFVLLVFTKLDRSWIAFESACYIDVS